MVKVLKIIYDFHLLGVWRHVRGTDCLIQIEATEK